MNGLDEQHHTRPKNLQRHYAESNLRSPISSSHSEQEQSCQ